MPCDCRGYGGHKFCEYETSDSRDHFTAKKTVCQQPSLSCEKDFIRSGPAPVKADLTCEVRMDWQRSFFSDIMCRRSMNNLKTVKKLYKHTLRPMGIFQIKNLVNGKVHIGRSTDLNGKINSEKFQLKNNMHSNKELQNDFNAQGEETFSFEILDLLLPKEDPHHDYGADLQTLEALWLEKLQPFGGKGYYPGKK
jgi:hypothetical protein